jgi:YbbR domain-containing protein
MIKQENKIFYFNAILFFSLNAVQAQNRQNEIQTNSQTGSIVLQFQRL